MYLVNYKFDHCYEKYGTYEVKLYSSREVDAVTYTDTTIYEVGIDEKKSCE